MYSLIFSFLVALNFCAVFGDCSSISKSFRRDHYFPNFKYPERWCDYPEEGGRVHYVYAAAKGLALTTPYTVTLGKADILLDESTSLAPYTGLDWVRASYNNVTGAVFVSFHAHTDSFLTSVDRLVVTDSTGTVLLDETDGVLLDPTDASSEASVQPSYVTSRAGFSELVVHLHNYGHEAEEVTALRVNGVAVLAEGETLSLAAGGHAVRVIPAQEQGLAEAATWTVVVGTAAGVVAGWGGRLGKELFPMESWPKGHQCPLNVEGANVSNFDTLYSELHLDTQFFSDPCDAEAEDVFAAAAASQDSARPWFVLPSEKYTEDEDDMIPPESFPGVAAVTIGDEADSSLEATEEHWQRAMLRDRLYPSLSVYMGGHSNHLNGAFAGISDIQGMDFYVAACAPHITSALHPMSNRGAYDYLRLSRDNHRPLTTWGYTQAYCADCWPLQANGNELVMQMAAVVAAGAKGMMLFQSDMNARGTPAWTQGGRFLASVAAARSFLREADIEGAHLSVLPAPGESGANNSIVEVLRAPEELMVLAVNQYAYNYSDVLCYLHELTPKAHWTFEAHTVQRIVVDVPADMALDGLAAAFEAGELIDGEFTTDMVGVDWTLDEEARQWSLSDVKLDGEDNVARMFMLRKR